MHFAKERKNGVVDIAACYDSVGGFGGSKPIGQRLKYLNQEADDQEAETLESSCKYNAPKSTPRIALQPCLFPL